MNFVTKRIQAKWLFVILLSKMLWWLRRTQVVAFCREKWNNSVLKHHTRDDSWRLGKKSILYYSFFVCILSDWNNAYGYCGICCTSSSLGIHNNWLPPTFFVLMRSLSNLNTGVNRIIIQRKTPEWDSVQHMYTPQKSKFLFSSTCPTSDHLGYESEVWFEESTDWVGWGETPGKDWFGKNLQLLCWGTLDQGKCYTFLVTNISGEKIWHDSLEDLSAVEWGGGVVLLSMHSVRYVGGRTPIHVHLLVGFSFFFSLNHAQVREANSSAQLCY